MVRAPGLQWLAERVGGWVCSWAKYLQAFDEEGLAVQIRKLEPTGRPLGDRAFLERLSSLLSRDLLPKKPGPPNPHFSPALSLRV